MEISQPNYLIIILIKENIFVQNTWYMTRSMLRTLISFLWGTKVAIRILINFDVSLSCELLKSKLQQSCKNYL